MAVLIASSLRKELSGDPLVDQRPPRDAGFSLREYALSRCLSAEEGRIRGGWRRHSSVRWSRAFSRAGPALAKPQRSPRARAQAPYDAADTLAERTGLRQTMPTVLICDNEEPLRSLIRAALDGNGYELVEARDGDEGLDVARRLRPDLIVLDMNDAGAYRARRAPGAPRRPVVREHARDHADRAHAGDGRDAALTAGVDRFLPKPFSPRALCEQVEELLEDRT